MAVGEPAPGASPSNAGSQPGQGVAKTQIRSINPITAGGAVAAGWKVNRVADTCDGSEPSAVAKASKIFECGASAAGYDACWQVGKDQAGCVSSPYSKSIDLMKLTGPATTQRSSQAVPWGVVLADGTTCQPAFGGGGATRADGYIARWFCSDKRELVAPLNNLGGGFNRSGSVWTVQADRGLKSPRTTVKVKAVSYAVR
ncbi:hypothetical protein VV02_24530 [Luteipulveratus mongoliensis]|uniref:Uncharacterized protein n=1 Tax=Luteipulveratus mongoliensis TaxID=571913 RepID=A0A0K1JNY0_9MICO|nr:hypothetical protein VV02_24530 [Luteipulveratus mongoliensis]